MKKKPTFLTRRTFIKTSSILLTAASLPNTLFARTDDKKLGVALVGLGNYASEQLAPALLETQNCYLAGIVTGTKSKEKIWQEKYNIPDKNVYNYANFDDIVNNDNIDIVYIVLPNSMHAEYSIRAAKAGKHVISEKPMAISTAECQQVIDTCKALQVKLGVGYRLHYEPFNREMIRLGQKRIYGPVNSIDADFSFNMNDRTQWRANKKYAGGGPLMDLGIYCLQGAIYSLGELPISVSARDTTLNKANWQSVEGSLEWTMKFESGAVANCRSSYEKELVNHLLVKTEKHSYGLNQAYLFDQLAGFTPAGDMNFPTVNQQALQMDDFANSVRYDLPVLPCGEMGLRDMFIVEKIYESIAAGGKDISLAGMPQVLDKVL
ncbi:Gfo/Idh/MocA family oxidoreductase [Paraglaciecola sp. 20A4]|uniref:Gfo/Idh/MocA family protein n=1 Tax=Paraglaciecola sp. 20A4 TaxID=2687288 RepID=UPI00140C702B|nr:Gfo/Idh/MocA family oxidoreductase [Paraglaciecola sp. 20A4]